MRGDRNPATRQLGLDDLLARLRDDGAEQDWQALLSRYQQRLTAVATRLVGEPSLADDAVQEALLRLRSALPRYQGHNDAQAMQWLVTITSRAAIDLHRRTRRRHQAVPLQDDHVADWSPDQPLDDGARMAVADALAQMPERRRIALLLHVVEDLPHRQVGNALGCSERTASSLVHRSLRELRERMRRSGYAAPAASAWLLMPQAWGADVAPQAGMATTAATVSTTSSWLVGAAALIAVPLVGVAVMGSSSATTPSAAIAPERPAAATPTPALTTAPAPDRHPLATIAPRPLRDLVVPVLKGNRNHLARTAFHELVLPALDQLPVSTLWVTATNGAQDHLQQVLPLWQELANHGRTLLVEFRYDSPAEVWQETLAALGPDTVGGIAIFTDDITDGAALRAELRAWMAARPGWGGHPIFDTTRALERAEDIGWSRCFHIDGEPPVLTSIPQIPANRPAGSTGPSEPPRFTAPQSVVADALMVAIAQSLRSGREHVVINEFIDRAAATTEDWRAANAFGLVDASGHPRPAFLALQRLLKLSNPATGAREPLLDPPTVLDQPLPPSIAHVVMPQDDGGWLVLLWQRGQRWDEDTREARPLEPVSIRLGTKRSATWTAWRVRTSGEPIRPAHTASATEWQLDEQVLVVRISP